MEEATDMPTRARTQRHSATDRQQDEPSLSYAFHLARLLAAYGGIVSAAFHQSKRLRAIRS